MKKISSFVLCVVLIASTFAFSASATVKRMTTDSSSESISDTVTLDVGSKCTIVGKGTAVWSSDTSGIGMNILGWKKNTNTLKDFICISVPTKYTGYLTVTVVEYPNGSPTVLSLSRTKGTKDDHTWYKELTKTSYTHSVTSFATIEGVYSSSDYYIGYPNVVNASK